MKELIGKEANDNYKFELGDRVIINHPESRTYFSNNILRGKDMTKQVFVVVEIVNRESVFIRPVEDFERDAASGIKKSGERYMLPMNSLSRAPKLGIVPRND